MFDDTSYTVCSFQFSIGASKSGIPTYIFPSGKIIKIELNDGNDYIIGGEIYKLPVKDTYSVERLTWKNKDKQSTSLVIKCIDTNSTNKIKMEYLPNDIYIDETRNCSARTYATLIISPNITIEEEKSLCERFNNLLNQYREKYNSLFLPNYRESKRISFELIYRLVKHLLS